MRHLRHTHRASGLSGAQRWLAAGCAVLALSVVTFGAVVGASRLRRDDASPPAGASTAAKLPAPSTAARKREKQKKASRVRQPASGQLLTAGAPLDQIKQDQGMSIALPDGRTLWIFGDTFQRTRRPSFFVTSAAATSEPGGRSLSYSLRATGDGATPTEFMPRTKRERHHHPGADYTAIWPTGSTTLPDGRILISYAKYGVHVHEREFTFYGSGLFAFRYRGTASFHAGAVAKRVADDIWTPADGEVRSPVYSDGYVYFAQCQQYRCYSLRTTVAGLGSAANYRWWTGRSWTPSRSSRAAMAVGTNHPGGNASVVRLNSGVYAMADTEVGAPSPYGYLWVAPRPWGPWSRAASFIMPACPELGCYGLNLHPSLSTTGILRVSYSTFGGPGVGPKVRVTDVPVAVARDGSAITIR